MCLCSSLCGISTIHLLINKINDFTLISFEYVNLSKHRVHCLKGKIKLISEDYVKQFADVLGSDTIGDIEIFCQIV